MFVCVSLCVFCVRECCIQVQTNKKTNAWRSDGLLFWSQDEINRVDSEKADRVKQILWDWCFGQLVQVSQTLIHDAIMPRLVTIFLF